tara:strand:- start:17437 stop:17586 length:150 start_codon:yes stop_codon:yes gene_type:complete
VFSGLKGLEIRKSALSALKLGQGGAKEVHFAYLLAAEHSTQTTIGYLGL